MTEELFAILGIVPTAKNISTILGIIPSSKQLLSTKYIMAHKKDHILILLKYFSTRNISTYSCINIMGYSK